MPNTNEETNPTKPFTASWTVRINLVAGSLLALIALSQTPEFSTILAFLPQEWRSRIAAALGLVAAIVTLYRKVYGTNERVAPPKIGPSAGVGALILAALLFASGCATAANVAAKLPSPESCGKIVTTEVANKTLADAQIVRIAARDTVADLYPILLDDDAVRRFDETLDKPFTSLYRRARKLIDEGRLDQFRDVCVEFLAYANDLLLIGRGAR